MSYPPPDEMEYEHGVSPHGSDQHEKELPCSEQIPWGHQPGTFPVKTLDKWFVMRDQCYLWGTEHTKGLLVFSAVSFSVLYLVFLGLAINHDIEKSYGLIAVAGVALLLGVYAILKEYKGRDIYKNCIRPFGKKLADLRKRCTWLLLPALFLGMVLYLGLHIIESKVQLQSALGLVCFSLVPWLTSKYPDDINWRPVIWGVAGQFVLGMLILRSTVGYEVVRFVSDGAVTFLEYSFAGASEVFGNPFFFFHPYLMVILPLVVFLGAWTALLTYLGITNIFLKKFGWLLSVTMTTTAVESVSLVANFFLSVLDSMLLLKEYLNDLTTSEFFTYLVGSHSSIAGFAFMLFTWFGGNPHQLITASAMSAPAAVAISKLNYPELEESVNKDFNNLHIKDKKQTHALIAAMDGALNAAKGVVSLMLQVIAFISLLEFTDATIGWFGDRVDVEITLRIIFSKLFAPVAWLMGVDWSECEQVGELVGMKVFTNEILAFLDFGEMLRKEGMSPRAQAITTYALCGFSSFGTLYMFVGAWRAVAPAKTKMAIDMIPRVLMCTNIACFMTACVAGIFYDEATLARVHEPTSGSFILFALTGLPGIPELMSLM